MATAIAPATNATTTMASPPFKAPRKVSFSSTLPLGLAPMTAVSNSPEPVAPSTPRTGQKPRFQRSPYVGLGGAGTESESDATSDVFAPSPTPGKHVPRTPPGRLFRSPLGQRASNVDDVFAQDTWTVPRSPKPGDSDGEDDGVPPPRGESPSPSPRKKTPLPRLDFSRAATTPLTARRAFAPKSISASVSPAPATRLGRKISLNNLGSSVSLSSVSASANKTLDGFDEWDEDEAEAVDLAVGIGELSVGESSFEHGGSVDSSFPRDDSFVDHDSFDRDVFERDDGFGVPEVAVESETDRSLSILTTPTRISSVTEGLLAPITPSKDELLASPRDEASDQYFSPIDILASPLTVPSPGGSIQILSPSPHRPLAAPSVPTTPSREAMGYNSDESEEWRPRTRPVSTKKRIVFDSDDEEAPRPAPTVYSVEDSPELHRSRVISDEDVVHRPKPKGLRGRTPAALRFLEESSEDEDEGDDADEGEELAWDEEDTAGSLADFIVEDDGRDLEFVVDDSDEGEGFDDEPAFDDEEDDLDGSGADTDDEFHDAPASPIKRHGPSIIDLVASSDEEDAPAPRFKSLSITSPPRMKSKSKSTVPASLATAKSKRAWEVQRAAIAQAVFDELDAAVFDGRLGPNGVDAKLEWGSRILRSAGNARMSRVRQKDGQTVTSYKITLADKVLTEEGQILSTVAHEMCHLAAWVISNEFKNPHGRVFKSWGRKVERARRDITVDTKHNYTISYKYEWQCSEPTCGKIYGRHSKSIDETRHTCGLCRGKLNPLFGTKSTTPFQAYLKANLAHAKAAFGNAPHGDVMRALSERWKEAGPDADHVAYWRSMAA
ncbi:hypothetical protein Q8F55_007208 [Vanrija albida]|uniref:SprT-like domain-containing protein n=1 Tax=Vanrija albida TaxID=181172 RepID=A0ABR3PZA0_9TREE